MESYTGIYKEFFRLNPDYIWNDTILLPALVLGGVIDQNEAAFVASKDLPVQKTVTLFLEILPMKDEMCHVKLINVLRRRNEYRLRTFLEVYFHNELPQASAVQSGVQGGKISPIHGIAHSPKPDQGPNNSTVPKVPPGTMLTAGAYYQHQNPGTFTNQPFHQEVPKNTEMYSGSDIQMKMHQLDLKTATTEAMREKISIVEPKELLEPLDPSARTSFNASIPTRCKIKFQAETGTIWLCSIRWSPTGRFLGTGGDVYDYSRTPSLKLWKVEEDLVTNWAKFATCTSQVSCIDFDSAETLLVAGREDSTISIFSIDDQLLLYSLKHSKDYVTATKFMGSSVKIASGAYSDSKIKIWDLTTSKCIQTFCAHSPWWPNLDRYYGCIDLVVAEPMGTSVISGHRNNKILFFDTRRLTPQREIWMDKKITSLYLSADNRHLLVCMADSELHYFDLRAHRLLQSIKDDGSNCYFYNSRAILSPDSQFCAVGSSNGKLYIWNVLTGKLENTLDSTDGITSCAWHPHGQLVATSVQNGTITIWTAGA